ncbi:hypothetical protein JTP77_024835 [Streptomyces sp. S9]|nr:hypothetical protein [Streptomyces sp. S9]
MQVADAGSGAEEVPEAEVLVGGFALGGSGVDGVDGRCEDIYANDRCTRCAITDRVSQLLAGPDGIIAPPFQPFTDALTHAEKPWSLMNWLRTSAAAGLLDELSTEHTEISHGLLDRSPQCTVTRNIRHHLFMTGALLERHETFARLELAAKATLEALPPHLYRIVSHFAEWHVIKTHAAERSAGATPPTPRKPTVATAEPPHGRDLP